MDNTITVSTSGTDEVASNIPEQVLMQDTQTIKKPVTERFQCHRKM
jgi:hypothetical protein